MQFVSIEFLCFLGVTVLCVRRFPVQWRSYILFASSYLFYCAWNWKLALLLFGVTSVSYCGALYSRKLGGTAGGSVVVGATVLLLVLLLTFFKLRPVLSPRSSLVIPLGMSYYTFRLIGYLLDVHWGKCSPVKDFVGFAAYVAFFPHILAGPIQRASSFIPQLRADNVHKPRTLEGLLRMALGFGKKVVVADNLGLFVGWAYSHLSTGSALPSVAALYLYPLQLYADFSGLTDIAIGSGLLLGIESPENFDAPFTAKSITEFWRRWHMSLTAWLRDYVFMPLRMATRDWGNAGLAFSLTVNMVLIGLWHGVSAGFLVYGLYHAAFLVSEALTSRRRENFFQSHPAFSKIADLLAPLFVFQVVAVGCVWFRAPSLAEAGRLFGDLGAGLGAAGRDLVWLTRPPNHHAWVALPAFALLALADTLRRKFGAQLSDLAPRQLRWSVYSGVAAMWVLIALALLATEKGADPFVYGLF